MTVENLKLIPVSKWNEHHNYPTVGAIRQLIFYNTNGFADIVVKRIGKRMYIDEIAFINWINSSNK